jgi:hypothetical protein
MTVTVLERKDTLPLMALYIYYPDPAMSTIKRVLSTEKNYTLDACYAQVLGTGTTTEFTLKTIAADGTSVTSTLKAGQTATQGKLTITSFTGATVPYGQYLLIDIVSQTGGTNPEMDLSVFGHEY